MRLALKGSKCGDEIKCKTCKEYFAPKWKDTLYCSKECYDQKIRKFTLTKPALKELIKEGKSLRRIGLDLKVDKSLVRRYCILWGIDYNNRTIKTTTTGEEKMKSLKAKKTILPISKEELLTMMCSKSLTHIALKLNVKLSLLIKYCLKWHIRVVNIKHSDGHCVEQTYPIFLDLPSDDRNTTTINIHNPIFNITIKK